MNHVVGCAEAVDPKSAAAIEAVVKAGIEHLSKPTSWKALEQQNENMRAEIQVLRRRVKELEELRCMRFGIHYGHCQQGRGHDGDCRP